MLHKRLVSSWRAAVQGLDPRYQVYASCLVQRPPIVMQKLDRFSEEYERYKLMVESEASRGVFRIPGSSADAAAADDEAHPVNSISEHLNQETDGSLRDHERILQARIPEYEALPQNDLRRELDRKLYLLVKDKVSGKWGFPETAVTDDSEGLATIAQKSLGDCFDVSRSDIYWTGNSPIAFLKQDIEGRAKSPFGLKRFFFKAQLLGGIFGRPSESVKEFAWATKEEAEKLVEPAVYQAISPVLSH